MKILLVITKGDVGGAQAFVLNLAKGLKKKGKDVSVAFGEGKYLPKELEKENINYYIIKNLKRSKNPFSILYYLKELRNLIKKERFDVIHLNSTNALPGVLVKYSLKKKIKTIFTVHGLSVLDKNYKASKVVKYLYKLYFKFFLQFTDKIVFVSRYNYEESKKEKIIQTGEVIYNGLNLDDSYFLSRDQARKELVKVTNINLQDSYVIGSIGRLATQKNYQFIINIWQDIKQIKSNAKLVLVGEGEERSRYERIIKEKNLEDDIYLVGEIKEASRLLKGFDLFVLSSIYEGLSISLIEAIASGIPAIASDVGGNKEVIGEENCYSLDDKEEFLEILRKGPEIKDNKEDFSVSLMINSYIREYEI